jgi:hypothetical protein
LSEVIAAKRLLCLLLAAVPQVLAAAPQSKEQGDMATARVRYMLNELDPAVAFYTAQLGFTVKKERRPNFALLWRGSARRRCTSATTSSRGLADRRSY